MSQSFNTSISEFLTSLITTTNYNNVSESSFLFYFKLFSFLIIIIITFSFGLLPLYFAHNIQGSVILNYANPFSGGIFIGIGLFHLLPDASYNFEQYYKTPEGKSSFFYGFPMSYFIVFLSYSFILFLEKVAFSSQDKNSNKSDVMLNEEILEPLLEEQNKENIDTNDDKIISSILYKRNKGKSNIIIFNFIFIFIFRNN